MRVWLGLACAWAVMGAALAAPGLQRDELVLLQPDRLMQERVQNIDAMASYLRTVEGAARQWAAQGAAANRGFVVLAVRPGPQARVWLDLDQPLPEAEAQALLQQLQAVPPFVVRRGPVVVALKLSWGGAEPSPRRAPVPADWKAAGQAAGKALPLEELLIQVWPVDAEGAAAAAR